MNLGTFSISLNVKDIQASKSFYEDLGFKVFEGDISQNWLIKADDNTSGPASFIVIDPDGNPILVDQHV